MGKQEGMGQPSEGMQHAYSESRWKVGRSAFEAREEGKGAQARSVACWGEAGSRAT